MTFDPTKPIPVITPAGIAVWLHTEAGEGGTIAMSIGQRPRQCDNVAPCSPNCGWAMLTRFATAISPEEAK